MIWKNIEIHNAAQLIKKDGGIGWLRVPENVMENMELPYASDRCQNSTGVELRFVMKSDKVTISMKSENGGSFHIYRGGIQGGWQDHESYKHIDNKKCLIEINKSHNIPTLEQMSKVAKTEWSPEAVRVIFDEGVFTLYDIEGDVLPPTQEQKPEKTILFYGSSITHGSNAINTSYTWASLVAHNLDMDYRNLGMAGCCAIEPEMVDYIAEEGENGNWDIAVLCLGINVLDWDEEKIRERVTNAIRQVAGRNTDKSVFIISPMYSNEDFNGGERADKWRKIMAEIVSDEALANLTYINGLDLASDVSFISADEIHPNIYGISKIAQKLTGILKTTLKL